MYVGTKFLTILIFMHLSETPFAEQNQQCVPSSCGHIHNISYPFRLKSDPKYCGHENYELSCEGNRTILYWYESDYYVVHAINYDNSTIRLVDPDIREQDLCSLQQHLPRSAYIPYLRGLDTWIYKTKPGGDRFMFSLAEPITIFSCPFAINFPGIVEITSCLNSSYASKASSDLFRGHRYATMAEFFPSDLKVGCTMGVLSWTSWNTEDANANISIISLHNALAYGFELSWFRLYCDKCIRGGYYCEGENSRDVGCFEFPDCQNYNFRYFSIPCGKNIPDIMLEFKTLIAFCNANLKDLYHPYFFVFAFDDHNQVNQRHVFRVLTRIVPWMLPIVGIIVAARVVLLPCIFVFLMLKYRRRHLSIFDAIESFLHSENNFMPIRYPYPKIKKMTRNFKEKLGQGGFGSVYKGKLQSGPNVAVKILSKPNADGKDFMNEIATIGRIHHVNVVQLIGYCAERCKRALVYDFMPNGSLEKYFTPREGGGDLLSWERKFEIALGVARGIEYLHRGCDIQILHFDIKPHNILLDENFIPKLSDFGLAKLYSTDKSIVTLTAARGTIGYVAPELINRSIGPISYKADVYSFGMRWQA